MQSNVVFRFKCLIHIRTGLWAPVHMYAVKCSLDLSADIHEFYSYVYRLLC